MIEPRDLTDLVPNHVRADLAVAIPVLEQQGPVVAEALRQLDQATTAVRQALSPVGPTEVEWRLVDHATGIDRGWMRPIGWCRRLVRPGRVARRRNARRPGSAPWSASCAMDGGRPGRLTHPTAGAFACHSNADSIAWVPTLG